MPAPVRGNDWRSLNVASVEDFEPELSVTVVIPYYETLEALKLTLAGLERQTYPRELFNVVIVDDGSTTPLVVGEETPLSLQVVHQENQGFGAARARNNGAQVASGEILVFLDCDMVPEADWLRFHARWHHAACDVLTLGFRRHLDVSGITAEAVRSRPGTLTELFADRPSEAPEWIENHMIRTDSLTNGDDNIYRMVTSGNLGVSASFFAAVSGFNESFNRWGGEDGEFGYRALAMGAVLIPERGALCWHQGPGAKISEEERQSLTQMQGKILNLIPPKRPNDPTDGRCFTVPTFVVSIATDSTRQQETLRTVEQVLASRVNDLVVWVEDHSDGLSGVSGDNGLSSLDWLHSYLDGDPRVHFGEPGGAAAAFPAALFHVTIAAGTSVTPMMLGHLRQQLGNATAARALLASGHQIKIIRSWALQRAQRRRVSVNEVGDVINLDGCALEAESRSEQQSSPIHNKPPAQGFSFVPARSSRLMHYGRVVTFKAAKVRNPRDAWRLLNWLVAAFRRRLAARLTVKKPAGINRSRLAKYSLGAELVACGDRASNVFAASARVSAAIGEQPADFLIVDTPQAIKTLTAGTDTPQPEVVVLSELPIQLAVPAFDPASLNPIGWKPDHKPRSASLHSLWSPPSGVPALLHLDENLISRLRKLHHITDSGTGLGDTVQRAGTLAALAAAGVVIHITHSDQALAECLGAELHDLMSSEAVAVADRNARERLSISMRRLALRDHSLRARSRQILATQNFEGFEASLPEVTVLLATRRPKLLAAAFEAVRVQNYPRLELVVALHGDGFGSDSTVKAAASNLDCPLTIVRVPKDKRLGEVLNTAVAASSGTLITKFDDDDYYSADHIWDLVLAREYSQATLVAKATEFVYLTQRDSTVRVDKMRERFVVDPAVSGGVLMISRQDLQDAGGWRRVPRRVDICLARDVKQVDGSIYWTHGAGYLRVRHGNEHTWITDDDFFVSRANDIRPGRDFEFAGF